MARSLCHIVGADDAGSRLDALCAAQGLYASRSAAARAIEEGRRSEEHTSELQSLSC